MRETSKPDQKSIPSVQSVVRHLEGEIASGSLAPGESLPPERALAELLGVGRSAVRSAISELSARGLILVRDRCRPTVVQTKERPNRTNADHIAAWIWPRSTHYHSSQVLKGIQMMMGDSGLRLVVGSSTGNSWNDIAASEAAFLRGLLTEKDCAGAIIWYIGGTDNMDLLREVCDSGFPLVFVDRIPSAITNCDFVGTDNVGSAFHAVTHLLELGHRRIACVTNLDHASSVSERIEGWREAHQRAGVPLDESLLINPGEGADSQSEDYSIHDQVRRMLSLDQPATAAFCINDNLAVSAMESLTKLGLRIPDDFSLVGFDGLMSWMPNGGGLSSPIQNFERMGQTAYRLLRSRMAQPRHPARHVLLDAPLCLNGSTHKLTARPEPAPSGLYSSSQ